LWLATGARQVEHERDVSHPMKIKHRRRKTMWTPWRGEMFYERWHKKAKKKKVTGARNRSSARATEDATIFKHALAPTTPKIQHNTKFHSGLICLFIIGLTTTQKIIIRIKGSELQRVIDERKRVLKGSEKMKVEETKKILEKLTYRTIRRT
jgi:hypothetical protein